MTEAVLHIRSNSENAPFEGGEYTLDLTRRPEREKPDCIQMWGCPFAEIGIPFILGLSIDSNGKILFRGWEYHFREVGSITAKIYMAEEERISVCGKYFLPTKPFEKYCFDTFQPTKEQAETIAGLFSGRIRWEGLRILIGGKLQQLCPIDIEAEAKRWHKKAKIRSSFPKGTNCFDPCCDVCWEDVD